MKRQSPHIAARRFGLALAAALFVCVLAVPARAAEVHVSINIGAPPPVIVHAPPRLVYLQEPAVYVAVGIPYDIFFVGGRYYHARGSHWYWAPRYGGPWNPIVYRSLPPGLRKFKVERLRDYRDREYRAYRVYEDGRRNDRFVVSRNAKSRGNGNGRR
jgi:hypothetical protein